MCPGTGPTLHLLHGFVGSGKTTYARKIEREFQAIRFTSDEWMTRLYGSNPPVEQFAEYYSRVESLILEQAERIIALGTDVILDFGFWKRSDRDAMRSRAREWGTSFKLYSFQCPEVVLRERVEKRNVHLPEDSLWIDEHAFNLFLKRFEPLGDDEEHVVIVTDSKSFYDAAAEQR